MSYAKNMQKIERDPECRQVFEEMLVNHEQVYGTLPSNARLIAIANLSANGKYAGIKGGIAIALLVLSAVVTSFYDVYIK